MLSQSQYFAIARCKFADRCKHKWGDLNSCQRPYLFLQESKTLWHSVLAHRPIPRRVRLDSGLDMLNVFLGGLVAADWASLLLRQVEGDHVAEFVLLSRSLHEPVAVDAQRVEAVVAVVDPDKVRTICEGLSLKISLTFSEWL